MARKAIAVMEMKFLNKVTNRNEAKIKRYIQNAMSCLADAVEAGNKPEDIDLAAYLELCSTDNGCRIAYTHINGDPDEVFTLTITVRKRHTDRDFTQFDFVGTSDEFIEYVRKPVYDYNEYYDRIMIMSDKADEYYS